MRGIQSYQKKELKSEKENRQETLTGEVMARREEKNAPEGETPEK
jgi:hypothetical protein